MFHIMTEHHLDTLSNNTSPISPLSPPPGVLSCKQSYKLGINLTMNEWGDECEYFMESYEENIFSKSTRKLNGNESQLLHRNKESNIYRKKKIFYLLWRLNLRLTCCAACGSGSFLWASRLLTLSPCLAFANASKMESASASRAAITAPRLRLRSLWNVRWDNELSPAEKQRAYNK